MSPGHFPIGPLPCDHPEDEVIRTRAAQWVFGDVAWINAKYYCRRCAVSWEAPNETPTQAPTWNGDNSL